MKVQGPGQAQGASNTKKSGKTADSDSHFGDFMTSGASSAESVKTTQSIGTVDSLLALQGAEDPAAQSSRKRMKQRAGVILGELDRLRTAMLTGGITLGHMIDIADVIASHREKINDPALTAIMDEVDLRAQVELAKMRMALDAKDGAF
ncbi:MAG: flagellar assembly protein FliX [Alphaproteobacteria bacterium]